MKRFFAILCIIIYSIFPSRVSSQVGKYYSTDKDLSNSLVNKVIQDSFGYIWVATEDGLNKFDGLRFSTYMNNPSDSTSIKNNYVRTIFEDRDHRLWVGCINGLQLYDRAKDNFINIGGIKEIQRPHVTSIIQRKNGDIWVGTSGRGIIILKKGAKNFEIETNISKHLTSSFISNLYEDHKSNIWISVENRGFYCYTASKQLKYFSSKNGLSDNVSSICEDRNGVLFLGSVIDGLYRVNINTFSFKHIPYSKNSKLKIKTLLVDSHNNVRIGTDGEGLKTYNRKEDKIEDFKIDSAPFDFSKSKVHSLLEDRDKNLWLGIFQKGLIFLPGTQNKFEYFGYKSIHNNTIGSNYVTSIYKDHSNTIWIGTDNDGLYAVNEQGQRQKHFVSSSNPQNSVPNSIMCIYEDSGQNLWVGSFFSGLAKVNRQSGNCQYLELDKGRKSRVISLKEDNARQLWVGTYGDGLYCLDQNSNVTMHFVSPPRSEMSKFTDCIPNSWINCIMVDKSNNIWVGTYKGLGCYYSKTKQIKTIFDKNDYLQEHIVYALLERGNSIWIGTGGGLIVLDKKTLESKLYTTHDGLANNVVCGLQSDKEGNVWISTHSGMTKYVSSSKRFISYYSADGLQGNEFSRGASFQDKSGKIYFGGINGVTCFYPETITEQKKQLRIAITNFYVFNTPIKQYDKSGIYTICDKGVSEASEFKLSNSDNTFNIELSAMDFSSQDRISFEYNIKELSNKWMKLALGTSHIAFTNLEPGKYTLRIRSIDDSSISKEKTIVIRVMPPWYKTALAKIIYLIILALIGFAVRQYILIRIKQKNERLKFERQEQMNEAKFKFFTDISHEIRTPITLITSPIEKLLKDNPDPDTKRTYNIIYRNAQRILNLINQLLDVRKIDNQQMQLKFRETNIVEFINDVMQTFEYQAKKKNINFTFTHNDKILRAWIDRNNFDKVLVNVLSNAFKFTQDGGSINILLRTSIDMDATGPLKSYFEIVVSDTGIGIDKDKIDRIFERYYQINEESNLSNFGTGIGLHLSKSLVELHSGTIIAENQPIGTGSRFTIKLPLGNSHISPSQMETNESSNSIQIRQNSMEAAELSTSESNANVSAPSSKSKYTVILIEDDEDIRNYLATELSPSLKILAYDNGKIGYEATLKEKPDLVISDIMLPGMDGNTICRKIKQNINVNHIPVILLTAKSKTEDMIEGLDTGADAYITKPFNLDLLKQNIASVIGNRERLIGLYTGKQQQDFKVEKINMKSSDEKLLEKIMQIINQNLAEPSLSVEMLAENVGLSRVHLHRKLKELTNQSARDFIRNIRLKEAARLLVENKISISETAYATGFSNPSHFSTAFKDFYGETPKDYILHHQQ